MPKFRESALAHLWCKGRGLEIGASACNPFGLDTLNVDPYPDEALWQNSQVDQCGEIAPIDIVAFAHDIPTPDNRWDFVVSSHVLEHCHDVIAVLAEWNRVVKPGGIIFTIVPHPARTFDAGKPRTSLLEIKTRWFSQHCERSPKHWNIWHPEDLKEVVGWMCNELDGPIDWSLVDEQDPDDKVGNGFTLVYRKEPPDG